NAGHGRRPRGGPVTATVGFDVIDVHHHLGSAVGSLGWSDSGVGPATPEADREGRLAVMDAGGVGQAIMQPPHNYLRPNGLSDTRRVNDETATYRDAGPERFPAALGVVQPQDGTLALDEVKRVATELGMVGISFHTLLQGC